MNVAVIGAGIAGLSLAKRLCEKWPVTVFEKSRGVSGRTSTRYAGDYEFDHGAQYFTIRSERFQSFLEPMIASGTVAEWHPREVALEKGGKVSPIEGSGAKWVGAPRMNAIAKALSVTLELQIGAKVTFLQQDVTGWTLKCEDGSQHGPFSHVILAIPARQAADLIGENHKWHSQLMSVRQTGNYTIMLGSKEKLNLGYDIARIKDSSLGWLAVNSSKPGRDNGGSALVVQSTNDWAEQHIDEHIPSMETFLLQELSQLTGLERSQFDYVTTHRWRYADTEMPLSQSHLFDKKAKIGICGDWCIVGRVEAAFESAMALADDILQ